MDFDIKEEVYKCSKCGLCQSVCPIYLATKNEMFLPRGRFIVLNNFFNNGQKLSNEFIKNLDVCLNCNLCKDFCPSNIDMKKISIYLKNKYSKKTIALSLYLKLIFLFSKIFNLKKTYKLKNNGTKGSVIYFEGCYNNYIDKSDKNATLELIEKAEYKVEKIISHCCGYPIISEGNIALFNKNAEKIIKSYNFDIDYIICSCDSCYETLKLIKNEDFTKKLIKLDEFLSKNGITLNENQNYFKPLILKENPSFEHAVNTINEKGICSLMENFFFLKHPKISKKIKNIIIDKYPKTPLFTTCNLTKWGVSKILKKKVYSLSEVLIKK